MTYSVRLVLDDIASLLRRTLREEREHHGLVGCFVLKCFDIAI